MRGTVKTAAVPSGPALIETHKALGQSCSKKNMIAIRSGLSGSMEKHMLCVVWHVGKCARHAVPSNGLQSNWLSIVHNIQENTDLQHNLH